MANIGAEIGSFAISAPPDKPEKTLVMVTIHVHVASSGEITVNPDVAIALQGSAVVWHIACELKEVRKVRLYIKSTRLPKPGRNDFFPHPHNPLSADQFVADLHVPHDRYSPLSAVVWGVAPDDPSTCGQTEEYEYGIDGYQLDGTPVFSHDPTILTRRPPSRD